MDLVGATRTRTKRLAIATVVPLALAMVAWMLAFGVLGEGVFSATAADGSRVTLSGIAVSGRTPLPGLSITLFAASSVASGRHRGPDPRSAECCGDVE